MDTHALACAEKLIHFIDASPTPFHATHNIIATLQRAGFSELLLGESWSLAPMGRYYVQRNGSAVIAFIPGSQRAADAGWRIAGAHTDSPALRLKTASEKREAGCVRLGVELYGSPILSSWLDRPLAIAGRVALKRGATSGLSMELVNLDDTLCLIPNAAIHMNRDINKGFEYNPQTHLRAILGAIADNGRNGEGSLLRGLLAAKLGVDEANIMASDLFFYDAQKGTLCGAQQEYISCGRLDNLAMCHAILEPLCASGPAEKTLVAAFYDNEEVGSRSPQGADSSFLRDLLERVALASSGGREDFHRAISRSSMISADAAHALHPNYADKHDADYAPLMNRGPVIKANANLRYATNAESCARFTMLCEAAKVPCQHFVGRSDMPSGSTIGPMSSALLGIPTVDIGSPLWAMHSIRETAGVQDHFYMIEVLRKFFEEG